MCCPLEVRSTILGARNTQGTKWRSFYCSCDDVPSGEPDAKGFAVCYQCRVTSSTEKSKMRREYTAGGSSGPVMSGRVTCVGH